MKTKVFTQFNGGSGLDARYAGSVCGSPEEVAEHLLATENVIRVEVFDDEIIAYGNRPF